MVDKNSIAVIGHGYWGKILVKNLINMGYKNITICEIGDVDTSIFGNRIKVVADYKKINADKVFVATPASKHYDICKHFLTLGKDVFCEKPLCLSNKKVSYLYDIAKKYSANLYVDWLFTFNNEIRYLKKIYDEGILGDIIHVNMSRQNYGPVRYDVDSKWDLSSHDLSILLYLFEQSPKVSKLISYNRLDGTQKDSNLCFVKYANYTSMINASWANSKKDRLCFFDFSEGCVTWDDKNGTLDIELFDTEATLPERSTGDSPLENSINCFMNLIYNKEQQEWITKTITNILSEENNDSKI